MSNQPPTIAELLLDQIVASAPQHARDTELAIEAQGLVKHFGDIHAVNGIDLRVRPGQVFGFLGQNGSGKTTLLRILAGLLPPTAGKVLWNDRDIYRQRYAFNEQLLYLGHLNGLKDELNAMENLRFGAHSTSENTLRKALAECGLHGIADLPVRVLSQGQKRRVALARLWCSKAALWLLDEPFSALDSPAAAALQDVIRAHIGRGGMVVLTTHQEVELLRDQPCTLTLGQTDA